MGETVGETGVFETVCVVMEFVQFCEMNIESHIKAALYDGCEGIDQ